MNTRLEIASRILQGWSANNAVFAANGMTGWSIVNITEQQLCEYALAIADDLIKWELNSRKPEPPLEKGVDTNP